MVFGNRSEWRHLCVDREFKAQYRVPCIVFIETVPPVLDNSTDLLVNGRVHISVDAEPSQKLGHVTVRLKGVDIITGNVEWRRRLAECGAVLREHKEVVVEFVGQLDRRVTGLRFWSPYLWWHVNHKGGGGCDGDRIPGDIKDWDRVQ